MIVELIAETKTVAQPLKVYGTDTSENTDDGARVIEIAGRACYQSWNKPNPNTRDRGSYIKNIIAQKHYSVLEHASVTFYVSGVSRSLLAELTRHRHLSFSVESQRFVKQGFQPVIPPAIRDDATAKALFLKAYAESHESYNNLLQYLSSGGLSRKQASEAARSVLPNAQSVDMVVTGNHRAWREVIQKRNSPHADAEIRDFAEAILHILRWKFEAVYVDLLDEPA